jgi:hypothetical protein
VPSLEEKQMSVHLWSLRIGRCLEHHTHACVVMLCHVGRQFRGSVNVKTDVHIYQLCLIPYGSIAG